MATGTWTYFKRAKEKLGKGQIDFSTNALRITLHKASASAALSAGNDITVLASVGFELAATGGYAANGKTLSAGAWGLSGNDGVYSACAVFWSASGANLGGTAIKYGVMHASLAGGTRAVLAYVTLTGTPITIASGSRITISHTNGTVFKLT